MLTSDTCYDSPAHNGMFIKIRKTTTAGHISSLIKLLGTVSKNKIKHYKATPFKYLRVIVNRHLIFLQRRHESFYEEESK